AAKSTAAACFAAAMPSILPSMELYALLGLKIALLNQMLTAYRRCAGGLAPLAVRSYWVRFTSFVLITRGFPMKAWIPLTLVFALGLAANAQATCTYPQAPAAPPNGATASRDEMRSEEHTSELQSLRHL